MPVTIPTTPTTNLTPCPVVALFRGHCLQELRLACLRASVCAFNPDLLDTTAVCQRLLDIVAPGVLFEGDGPSDYVPADVYTSHEGRIVHTW